MHLESIPTWSFQRRSGPLLCPRPRTGSRRQTLPGNLRPGRPRRPRPSRTSPRTGSRRWRSAPRTSGGRDHTRSRKSARPHSSKTIGLKMKTLLLSPLSVLTSWSDYRSSAGRELPVGVEGRAHNDVVPAVSVDVATREGSTEVLANLTTWPRRKQGYNYASCWLKRKSFFLETRYRRFVHRQLRH